MAKQTIPAWFASDDARRWLRGLSRFARGLPDQYPTRRAFGLAGLALARLSGGLPDDKALGPHVSRVLLRAAAGEAPDRETFRLLKGGAGARRGRLASRLVDFCSLLLQIWQPDLGDADFGTAARVFAPYAEFLNADEQAAACDALRCIFGGLVRPTSIDPPWLTANGSAVARLAEEAEGGGRPDVLPVLGDALEEAGCTDEALLGHCRSAGRHVPGCWVVAAIVGEPEWGQSRQFGALLNCWSLHLYCERDDRDALTGRAFALSKVGWYDELIEDTNSLLALNPVDEWAYQMRGLGHQQKKEWGQALADFGCAVELESDDAWTHAHIGFVYNELGRFDDALAAFANAIRLNRRYGWAWAKRGYTHLMKGDSARAAEALTLALEGCPDYADDSDRAWAYANLGWAYNNLGQFDEALAALARAIEMSPDYGWAWGKRGYALSRMGDHTGVIEALTHALERCPEYAELSDYPWAQATRGATYLLVGQPEKGIADLTRAVECPAFQTNSALPWALNELAWALATWPDRALRDGRRAVELATRACELSGWKDASHVDTLAAAHAEAGDFGQAVRLQEQALALGGLDDDAARRLDLYRGGQPYRASV